MSRGLTQKQALKSAEKRIRKVRVLLPAAEKVMAVEDVASGMSRNAVGRKYGVTGAVVGQWCKLSEAVKLVALSRIPTSEAARLQEGTQTRRLDLEAEWTELYDMWKKYAQGILAKYTAHDEWAQSAESAGMLVREDEKDRTTAIKNMAAALAIAHDKLALVRGTPTSITEATVHTEVTDADQIRNPLIRAAMDILPKGSPDVMDVKSRSMLRDLNDMLANPGKVLTMEDFSDAGIDAGIEL